MKSDLAVILREILSRRDAAGGRLSRVDLRACLQERGVSESLIEDAMFLFDIISTDPVLAPAPAGRDDPRPSRMLSSEELRGLDSGVVGKLFQLYYLGYLKKDELESAMTDLLFVPPESQDTRARESISRLLGVTPAQADFLFDGGPDAAVLH